MFFGARLAFWRVGLGIMVWTGQTPVFYTVRFVGNLLNLITRLVPNYISGPLAVIGGLLFIILGANSDARRHYRSFATWGNNEDNLWDAIATHRRLRQRPSHRS